MTFPIIDLSGSGLPLSLKDGMLVCNSDAVFIHASAPRTIQETRPYLRDADAAIDAKNIYWMHRGVTLRSHEELFSQHGIRYDVTVLASGVLGREFYKTIGHFHAIKPGTTLSYPEVYEVLHGNALFLFQYETETYGVLAGVSTKVIVPPGFGHVTVNVGSEPLVIANLFCDHVDSRYDFYRDHQGAAYYVLATELAHHPDARGAFVVERNPRYASASLLRMVLPHDIPSLGITSGESLYASFVRMPSQFDFLSSPERYTENLTPAVLFSRSG